MPAPPAGRLSQSDLPHREVGLKIVVAWGLERPWPPLARHSSVSGRCQRMITAVRGMLDQHRVEQKRELDRLAVLPATGNEQARKQLLEEVLRNPLRKKDR